MAVQLGVAGVVRAPSPEHDGGHGHVTPPIVGARHDGRIRDRGVGEQHGLDLGRGDVLPAADDAVDAAIDDEQSAVGIEAAEVACAHRSDSTGGGQGGGTGRSFVLAQVPAEPAGGLDQDLPHPVRVGVIDRHPDARQRPAGAVGMLERVGRRQGGCPGRRLGQAIGRDDRPSRADRPGDERGRDRASAQQHGPERRRGGRAGGRVEEPGQLRRHERDVAQRRLRVERGKLRTGIAGRDDPDRNPATDRSPQDAEAGDMPQPECQLPAGRGRQAGEPRIGACGHRAPGQDDAPGPSGGPRRQHDDGRGIRIERPVGEVLGAPGQDGLDREDRVSGARDRGAVPLRCHDERGPEHAERGVELPGHHPARDRRQDRARTQHAEHGRDRVCGRLGDDTDGRSGSATRRPNRALGSLASRLEPGPGQRAGSIDDRERATRGGRVCADEPVRCPRASTRRPIAHQTAPTNSTRNRASARSSTSTPRPPAAEPPGTHIRPESRSRPSTSRSCSSSPAVARP